MRRVPSRTVALPVALLVALTFLLGSGCNSTTPTLPNQSSWERTSAPQLAEPPADHTPTIDSLAANDDADCYVYVTRTGSKYHRAGCRYLSQSKKRVTLEYAKAHRYGACKVCRPPKRC